MPAFNVTVLIRRPAAEVFAYFVDPANRVEWSDHVAGARWVTAGPAGVGSVSEINTRQWGRTFTTKREITVFEPNRRLCYQISSPMVLVDSCQAFEAQDDHCPCTVRGEGQLKGPY